MSFRNTSDFAAFRNKVSFWCTFRSRVSGKKCELFPKFPLREGLLLLVSFPGANLIPSLNSVDSENAVSQLRFAG